MDITFNESFAASLANTLNTPVIKLPAEFQFGQLTKLAHSGASIWQLKQRYDPLSTVTFSTLQQAQAQLLIALKAGDSLRLWTMTTVDDELGLRYLCNLLQRHPGELTRINVPINQPLTSGNTISLQTFNDLGELDPDTIPKWLPQAVPVTTVEQTAYAYDWQQLTSDHQPLHTLINGQLLGTNVDFYDSFLIPQCDTSVGPQPASSAKPWGATASPFRTGGGVID